MSDHEAARLKETIELLAGTRGRGIRKAAVRIEDIEALLTLPPSLKSAKAAGAAPTAAEYDALVADVRTLHSALLSIATALQSRIL